MAEAELAAAAGTVAGRRQLRLGHRGALQQDRRVPGQDERRIGEPDAAAGPLQQRHARLALELRELLGHR